MMVNLNSHLDLSWLASMDFNEIFYNVKRGGGEPKKSLLAFDDFRNAFLDIGLFNLDISGYDVTWCNYRRDEMVVNE